MNWLTTTSKRVLAVDPYTRGFGFVIIEGENTLLDWGLKEARTNKHARCLRLVEDLIDVYEPNVIIVEDIRDKSCHRCARVRELIQAIEGLAKAKKVKARSFSYRTVKAVFFTSQNVTRHLITDAIVERFPELAPWRPPVRKAWMSEDPRTRLFTAMALAISLLSSISDR